MNKQLRLIYLLLLLFSLNSFSVKAQADFGSEEELKKQAAKLFDEEEFEKAYPLYTQLVSLYKKDPNYNFRLGVCMLYADVDREKPIPYLELSLRSEDVDKDATFYLAKAYHLNYRFDDAIYRYKAYKKMVSSAKAERHQVDRQIEMCDNGKRLLNSISDLSVLDKVEMNREDFFRAYDISGIGGKLLVKPDEKEFRTSLDKKKKESSILYRAPNSNEIYFSSYGDSESHGKDIYRMKKTTSGEWGKPESIGNVINTKYDEDFPFVHPNGKIMYFCSKGHNSMGGYDIFKSIFNDDTKQWGPPVNMDFPINTPDDDILYISDKDEKQAYFSSGRTTVAKKIAVYHINVDRKSVEFVIIKGNLIKNHSGQKYDAKITIKNLSDNNSMVGMFDTKTETGTYDIKLPNNGGKYLFTVESSGFATQSEVVEVPVQTKFTPLKQEMVYEMVSDKLHITSHFTDAPSDTSYLMVINLIKERSKLDVTPVISEPLVTDVSTGTDTEVATNTSTPVDTTHKVSPTLSNEDIVRIAYRDAKETEAEAKELKEQADIAWSFANQKNELAKSKTSKEAEELNAEAVAAFNMAKKIESTAVAKQEEADLSKQYAEGLEAATKPNSPKEAMAKLEELEKKLEAVSKANDANSPILNSFQRDEEMKKKELDKALLTSSDLKKDIEDNKTIIAGLKTDAENEKNEQIKNGLNSQIAGLEQENVDKQKQLAENEQRVPKLQKEYEGIKTETALVSNVVNESKISTPESASAQAATVDKAKLEEQINTVKNTTVAVTPVDTTVVATTTTPEIKTNDTTATVAKTDSVVTPTAAVVKSDEIDASEIQISYANPTSGAQAARADSLDGEADDMLAKSISYRAEATNKLKGRAQKKKMKEADDLANEAQTKKEQVEQLYANANRTEYTANQTELDNAVKANTGSTSPEIFKAELLNDEAKKYFDKAQQERIKAAKAENGMQKEEALAKAFDNEKIALQKQKEAGDIYKKSTPVATVTPITNSDNTTATNTNTNLDTTATVTTNSNTSAMLDNKELADIYKKYEKNLTISQDIVDEEQRERTKAEIYQSWSNAINENIEKQKLYVNAETDATIKAQREALLTSSQTSAKDKQALAEECLAKADALKQKNSLAVVTPNNTANTTNTVTPDNTNTTNDNSTTDIAKNNVVESTPPETDSATGTPLDYNSPEAAKQVEKAYALNDEADQLLAESILPQLETTSKGDGLTPEQRKKKSQDLINQAQTKKTEASALFESANSSEYTSKQNELAQLSKANASNNSGDMLKAEILNDEAQKHFNIAQEERKKAKQTASYYEREMMLDDARDNEQIALQKQQEAITIYKNSKPTVVASTNTNVSTNTNTNTTSNNPTDNSIATNANVNTTNNSVTPTPVATKQFDYANSNAMEQSVKAASLNKQADDLMALSVELKNQAAAQSNGSAKNTIYEQSEELIKEAQDKRIEAAQLTAAANADEYNSNNDELKQYAAASANNKSGELLKAEILNDEAEAGFLKAKQKRSDAANSNGFAKEKLLEEANADELAALKKQAESKDIYKKYKPSDVVITTAPTIKNTDNTNDNNSTEIVLAPNEAFDAKTTKAYSANNPIPIDAKLPSGLIFKVQIGAFRKPIPQNLFTGMTPITGERTSQGFIRYTAGIFTKFNTADKVKNKVKAMGYKDAFVVAFLNGKRIPINEAYALAEGTPSTVLQVNKITDNTSVAKTTDNNKVADPNEVIKSQSLASLGGLFYTVQVGLFTKPVPASKLYSMSPLFSETTANGYTRYYTGVYKSAAKANDAKNIVNDIGLRDAFVTAYYNGKRISVTEAQKHEAAGDATFPSGPEVNKLPTFKSNSKSTPTRTVTPEVTKTPTSEETKKLNAIATENSAKTPDNGNIIYKVQVGAFADEVPIDMANKFLKIAQKGIANTKDAAGLTVYTVGNCKTYEEALKLREEVVAESLTDAFIVAFRDGEKISIDDARQTK